MTMKERLNESYKKQNARRQGSLDYCSFFEGYAAGLQERDIVLEKLNIAKELLAFWVNDFYDAFNNVNKYEKRHKVLVESERFLKEHADGKQVSEP